MPQPLSTFAPNSGFTLAAGNTPHSPEMATSVFAVVNLWAQIDSAYSVLLANIARADPVTITAAQQAVQSPEIRKAALLSAALSALPKDEYCLINAVIESCRASRNQRNSFVHYLWGEITGRRDCVLLMSPKVAAQHFASVMQSVQSPGLSAVPEIDKSKIMVWNLNDFRAAEDLARVCHDRTVQLSFVINQHPAADHRRQSLLADPQIARLHNLCLCENSA